MLTRRSFLIIAFVIACAAAPVALAKTSINKINGDPGKYYNKKEQLDTNREFAEAYIDLYEEEGYDAVVEVGPNPKTSWNSRRVEPELCSACADDPEGPGTDA